MITGALINDSDDDDIWAKICDIYEYDINKKENGVYLPGTLAFACHLRVPLHFKKHGSGFGGYEMDPSTKRTITYTSKIESELNIIRTNYTVEEGETCPGEYEDKFVEDMDKFSKETFDRIESYEWTITFDGINYKRDSPIGCGNKTTIKDKQTQVYNERTRIAKQARKEGIEPEVNGIKLQRQNVKYIRDAREAILRNYLTPCNCNHAQQYPGIAPRQVIKYGGTY